MLGGIFKKDNCGCPCRDYYVAKCQVVIIITVIIVVVIIITIITIIVSSSIFIAITIVTIVTTNTIVAYGLMWSIASKKKSKDKKYYFDHGTRLNMWSTATRMDTTQSVRIELLECREK